MIVKPFKFVLNKVNGLCLRKRRQRLELSIMRIKSFDECASSIDFEREDSIEDGADYLSEDASASLCDSNVLKELTDEQNLKK